MVSATEQIDTLNLSASDLKELTDWPDVLIEDYLTILRNLLSISGIVDGDIQNLLSSNEGMISQSISALARFQINLKDLEQLSSSSVPLSLNYHNGELARPPAIGNAKPNAGSFTDLDADDVDLNGGNIDDTAIGSAVRSTGEFTTAESTGFIGAFNAPIAAQFPTISDPAGGATIDTEARAAIVSLIDSLQRFGYVA